VFLLEVCIVFLVYDFFLKGN